MGEMRRMGEMREFFLVPKAEKTVYKYIHRSKPRLTANY
jgi:hypothetical protein